LRVNRTGTHPSLSAETQAIHERRIFRRFAQRAELGVQLTTVRSRRPPEPDIRCRTVTGDYVAFELVEIVDEGLKRGMADQLEIHAALEQEWAKRPRHKTRSRYSHAMPAVTFSASARRASRLAAVPSIIDLLLAQDPEPVGAVEFARSGKLKPVSRLFVHQGGFSGPCFDVSNGGAFADPLWNQVKAKIRMPYVTVHQIELLAFYDLQSPRPGSIGLPPILEGIMSKFEQSAVRRVWVYDATRDEVLLRLNRPGSGG